MVTKDVELHLDGVRPAFDLVNSEYWYGLGPLEDRLGDDEWRDGFLRRWGFAPLPAPTGPERDGLVALRALLRRLIEAAAAERRLAARDVDEMNRFVAQPAVRRLRRGGGGFVFELGPLREGWPWVMAETAASLAELFASGDLRRIKACANGDCRFAYYDATKNGSRRWCAQAICGNRSKGRRFRARRRASAG